jgi:DNA methylase
MPRAPVSSLTPPLWRNRVQELRYLSPRELDDHPLQHKVHPDQQRSVMRGVLQEIGMADVLLAYVSPTTNRLTAIDGHLRKSLGDTPWPTVILDVDDAEAAYILAIGDELTTLALKDQDALTRLLREVQSGDSAVQRLLSELAEREGIVPAMGGSEGTPGADVEEPDVPWDRLAEVMARWQVQPGDVWALGPHRLLCGDCMDDAVRLRLFNGSMPAMVFADPPYGVSIVATNGYVGGGEAYDIPFGGVKQPRQRGYVGGGQRQKDLTGHYPIETWGKGPRGTVGAAKPFGSKADRGSVGASHVVAVGKYAPVIGDDSPATAIAASTFFLTTYPHAVHVWWGGNYYADHLPASSCWLVWDKETTGNFADCELAWTNQDKAARLLRHRWNGMLRASEHERRWHPTQKPAALAAWVYEVLGQAGDVVFDPFVGSGPSVLAAEQRNRTLYGCELSSEYVAITLQRWADLTGQTPVVVR